MSNYDIFKYIVSDGGLNLFYLLKDQYINGATVGSKQIWYYQRKNQLIFFQLSQSYIN